MNKNQSKLVLKKDSLKTLTIRSDVHAGYNATGGACAGSYTCPPPKGNTVLNCRE